MDISKIRKALIKQRNNGLSSNLYHKTQIDFAYNTNYIEGLIITLDETASIYDTGTTLTNKDKNIVLKDVIETKNHFTLLKYMLDSLDESLSEEMIKLAILKLKVLFYSTTNQGVKLEVNMKDDTVWLIQEQMAKLFGKAKSTINEHIKNIYKEGELEESETMTKFGNFEFTDKPTNYYDLDAILSVGYRVKSKRGIEFRK